MALPIILEGSPGTDAGQRQPDNAGIFPELELWSTSGLDYGYTTSRIAVYRSQVVRATWAYDRIGGADSGDFILEGGIADLDTAIQSQYEIRAMRQGVIWYKGRVTAYRHFATPEGSLRTRIWTEGYQTKLSEIRVNRTVSVQAVRNAVQEVWTNDIYPNSRVRSNLSAIAGTYVLAGPLIFDCTAMEALRTLAIIQGSIEWGVSEAVQLVFIADGTLTSETAHVPLGYRVPEMAAGGAFQRAYNRVVGFGANGITATGDDASAQTQYGVREAKVTVPWITHVTDLQRYVDNIVAAEKDGQSRLYGKVEGPTARLENARVNPGQTIPVQNKFTFWGIDGSKTTEHFLKTRYTYETSPPRFFTEAWAGAPEETLLRELQRIKQRADSAYFIGNAIETGYAKHFLVMGG